MTDDRSPAQRSQTMRRVKGANTTCELRLRSALHRRGLRYSLRKQLPGKPDIILVRSRIAVFVDGCFWHGCPQHCRRPATNRDYWDRKIDRNIARDQQVNTQLKALGWRVVRIWEHEITQSPARCAARIARIAQNRLKG